MRLVFLFLLRPSPFSCFGCIFLCLTSYTKLMDFSLSYCRSMIHNCGEQFPHFLRCHLDITQSGHQYSLNHIYLRAISISSLFCSLSLLCYSGAFILWNAFTKSNTMSSFSTSESFSLFITIAEKIYAIFSYNRAQSFSHLMLIKGCGSSSELSIY